jgi:hypothetical protein
MIGGVALFTDPDILAVIDEAHTGRAVDIHILVICLLLLNPAPRFHHRCISVERIGESRRRVLAN